MDGLSRAAQKDSALRSFAAGDFRTALTHAMELVRADPSRADMMACAGQCLIRLGDERAAFAVFKHATQIQPFNVEALTGAADAARLLNKPETALEYADLAMGLDPNALGAARVHSAVLRTSGRADEAARFFKPYYERANTDPNAVCEWADLCRATDLHDEGIEALERTLAIPNLPPIVKRSLNYRLAHLLDEQDRYRDAFAAAARANPAPTRDAVVPAQAIARMWSPQVLDSIPRSEPREPTPILIVGMPRSGTTLTARLLAAHPQIGSAGESPLLGAIARDLHQLGRAPDQAWCQQQTDKYAAMLRQAGPNATAVVDKMPGNFMNLGVASRILPNARVIHCRRDPRDVCLSCYFQPFSAALEFTSDLVQCARQCVAKDLLMEHWSGATGLPIQDLAYERLALEPEREIRSVLEFVGVGFDEVCLDPQAARQHETTASWSRVSRAISPDRVGRWRRYAEHIKPMLDWFESRAEPAAG